MKFEKLDIQGLVIITPKVFEDSRGFFLESYNQKVFGKNGINIEFVQDNHSHSTKNVLRGLHYQIEPFAQDKLIRVTRGKVFDVAVDIRKDSKTFGRWYGVELSAENKKMFFIPKGFAHAFLTLTDEVDFNYKVSNLYSVNHDRGLLWNDLDIGIKWPIKNPILSEKDKNQPKLKDLKETL
ncbi:dTDP-4-dehydrorhamnose 3,5-epimerase [Patescibacteria group bacterium]